MFNSRRYMAELGGAFVLYAVLLVGSNLIDWALNPTGFANLALALSPMIGALAAAWAIMRGLWRMDELQRRIQFDAIAFSFLTGEGLWADPGAYRRPAKACAGQIGKAEPKAGPCADLIGASDKAREQWRHERLLAAFEAAAR